MTEARQLPAQEHLTVQRVKDGAVDLTGAHLFLTQPNIRTRLLDHLKVAGGDRTCPFRHGQLLYFSVVRLLLQSLSHLHALWCCKSLLSPVQLTEHRGAVEQFRQAWEGLGWKPTVWVHWACAHSCFFSLKLIGQFFLSVPSPRNTVTRGSSRTSEILAQRGNSGTLCVARVT